MINGMGGGEHTKYQHPSLTNVSDYNFFINYIFVYLYKVFYMENYILVCHPYG